LASEDQSLGFAVASGQSASWTERPGGSASHSRAFFESASGEQQRPPFVSSSECSLWCSSAAVQRQAALLLPFPSTNQQKHQQSISQAMLKILVHLLFFFFLAHSSRSLYCRLLQFSIEQRVQAFQEGTCVWILLLVSHTVSPRRCCLPSRTLGSLHRGRWRKVDIFQRSPIWFSQSCQCLRVFVLNKKKQLRKLTFSCQIDEWRVTVPLLPLRVPSLHVM